MINLTNVINRQRIFVQINTFTNPIKEMKCKQEFTRIYITNTLLQIFYILLHFQIVCNCIKIRALFTNTGVSASIKINEYVL